MKVSASIKIKGARDSLFDYVADHRNATKWDKSVSKIKKTTPGPIKRLTGFEFSSKGLSIDYVIMQYEKPVKLSFSSSSMVGFEAEDEYSFEQADKETKVTQTTEVKVDGLMNWLLGLLKPVFIIKAKMTLQSLRKVYELEQQ